MREGKDCRLFIFMKKVQVRRKNSLADLFGFGNQKSVFKFNE
jgi:hypothetical protein